MLNWNCQSGPCTQVCGSITLSKFGVNSIFAVGDIAILYDFASLAWKCITTPPFWVFWGFKVLNPLKFWIVIKTPRRHILVWGRVIIKRWMIRPGVSDVKFHEIFCFEIFHKIFHEIFLKCSKNFTRFFPALHSPVQHFLYVILYYLSFIYAYCSSLSLSACRPIYYILAWFACLSHFTP